MATRYIPKHPFTCADKNGRKRSYQPDHIGKDGTLGYTPEEVEGLYRDHLASFRVLEVTGATVEDVVETATAAPGEKRAATKKATVKKTVRKPTAEKPAASSGDATVSPAPVTTTTKAT